VQNLRVPTILFEFDAADDAAFFLWGEPPSPSLALGLTSARPLGHDRERSRPCCLALSPPAAAPAARERDANTGP
jgi:hypothetical protein